MGDKLLRARVWLIRLWLREAVFIVMVAIWWVLLLTLGFWVMGLDYAVTLGIGLTLGTIVFRVGFAVGRRGKA